MASTAFRKDRTIGVTLVDPSQKKHVYCSIPLSFVTPAFLPCGSDRKIDPQAFAEKIRDLAAKAADQTEDTSVVVAIASSERFRVVSRDDSCITLDLGSVLAGSHWISTSKSPRNKPTLEMALRNLLLCKLVAPHMRRAAQDKILVYQEYPSSSQ